MGGDVNAGAATSYIHTHILRILCVYVYECVYIFQINNRINKVQISLCPLILLIVSFYPLYSQLLSLYTIILNISPERRIINEYHLFSLFRIN